MKTELSQRMSFLNKAGHSQTAYPDLCDFSIVISLHQQ